MPDSIRFAAITWKVQTIVDGGVRVSLDLIGSNPEAVTALMATVRPGVFVEWAGVPVIQEQISKDAKVSTWTKREPEGETEEGPGAN